MTIQIEQFTEEHLEAVVRLSLDAWAPVFPHIEQSLNPEVYRAFYPDGWRVSQERDVTAVCQDENMHVWIAMNGDDVAGFTAVRMDAESKMGEIYMIAVDPAFHRRGIALTLTNFALQQMRDAGMSVAMVETGADPGHAPARNTYEKAGFDLCPVARYFMKL